MTNTGCVPSLDPLDLVALENFRKQSLALWSVCIYRDVRAYMLHVLYVHIYLDWFVHIEHSLFSCSLKLKYFVGSIYLVDNYNTRAI